MAHRTGVNSSCIDTAPYGFQFGWDSSGTRVVHAAMSDGSRDRDVPDSASLSSRSGVRSPPANLPRDLQKLELSFIELNKERARQKEWKKLIRDMVFQRGKIPLLLAVEAGNQSMVRELLSAQTAEQLKVCACSLCSIDISADGRSKLYVHTYSVLRLFLRITLSSIAVQRCLDVFPTLPLRWI